MCVCVCIPRSISTLPLNFISFFLIIHQSQLVWPICAWLWDQWPHSQNEWLSLPQKIPTTNSFLVSVGPAGHLLHLCWILADLILFRSCASAHSCGTPVISKGQHLPAFLPILWLFHSFLHLLFHVPWALVRIWGVGVLFRETYAGSESQHSIYIFLW